MLRSHWGSLHLITTLVYLLLPTSSSMCTPYLLMLTLLPFPPYGDSSLSHPRIVRLRRSGQRLSQLIASAILRRVPSITNASFARNAIPMRSLSLVLFRNGIEPVINLALIILCCTVNIGAWKTLSFIFGWARELVGGFSSIACRTTP